MPARAVVMGVLLAAVAVGADPAGRRVKLAATLFGQTVGEVQLSRVDGAVIRLTYRSDLRVIRDKLRFRNQALIEVSLDPSSGQLIHSQARRCTMPEDGAAPPSCEPLHELSRTTAAPALAAEILLARTPDGKERCIDVVDEESGTAGQACGVAKPADQGIEVTGSKLNEPFRAVVDDGLPVQLELPNQGALFSRVTSPVQLSNSDLFAEPIPTTGDAQTAVRSGDLKLRVFGMPAALASLRHVTAPGQRATMAADGSSLQVEVRASALPRGKRSRAILDRVALMLAKARGGHVDCQGATAWFIQQARARGWKATSAEGLAFVDGRFAYHQWAIIKTPGGSVPIDPLLAQVPADAGHVQFADAGESAGALLVSFQNNLSLAVE